MAAPRRLALAVTAILLFTAAAHAAVLCAQRGRDGTFSTTVKIREACRPAEVTLTPELKLSGSLILRGDLRFDLSNHDVFDKGATEVTDHQLTFGLNAIFFQ